MATSERNGEDLGVEGRKFTNSKIFVWLIAAVLGTGTGSGVNILRGDPELAQKVAILEYKIEQQEASSKEINEAKDETMNQRLSRIENDIKDIKRLLEKK